MKIVCWHGSECMLTFFRYQHFCWITSHWGNYRKLDSTAPFTCNLSFDWTMNRARTERNLYVNTARSCWKLISARKAMRENCLALELLPEQRCERKTLYPKKDLVSFRMGNGERRRTKRRRMKCAILKNSALLTFSSWEWSVKKVNTSRAINELSLQLSFQRSNAPFFPTVDTCTRERRKFPLHCYAKSQKWIWIVRFGLLKRDGVMYKSIPSTDVTW